MTSTFPLPAVWINYHDFFLIHSEYDRRSLILGLCPQGNLVLPSHTNCFSLDGNAKKHIFVLHAVTSFSKKPFYNLENQLCQKKVMKMLYLGVFVCRSAKLKRVDILRLNGLIRLVNALGF